MHVAFYRNLNLGHPGSPTRAQLEGALRDAGADGVRSFQTNGTVLIVASDPLAVVRAAADGLAAACGYGDAVQVRTVAGLEALLHAGHFDGHVDERTYRETFTFFEGGRTPEWPLPWTNPRGDVDIVHIGDGTALAVVRKPGNTAGNPTAMLERETGGVATTRTRGSIERLLAAAASW
ncbi:DUF1697 domain-containing protein [Microbacterium sp. No. 7]|uniref:DUF1697 domain-containing protein n=1 Tax=Microbacterium sp. No. 7 TaxID=1714373 RepID=UPI0006ECDF03|nr:DUF1697 domain-containing protein [Microbacterium sp. No. 7]ALJ21454.1 hypothetical protein AOA12_16780 [Microbacterium sp. No. 7]